MRSHVDRHLLIITIILALAGFFIFFSASLGLLARGGDQFSGVLLRQGIALGLGLGLLFITSRIPYRWWGRSSIFIFLGSIVLTLLVFIPSLGFTHGGATRWLSFGPITLQPAELLKFGFVVYFAAWLAGTKQRLHDIRFGVVPFVILLGLVGGILIFQPDIGTFMVIALTGVGMFVAAGGKWKQMLVLGLLGLIVLAVLTFSVPYIKTRVTTFLDPSSDPLGSSYQVQQSLIAIGSGGLLGRGFGQSVQKFNYLPEPVGDSIFAVFAEEWGFVGVVVLLSLFVLLILRGFRIASRAPNLGGGLLVVGIMLLISIQSFINIASMLGIFPLTGMPLLFVSQGGTALVLTLAEMGIVLNVSKYAKTRL